AEPGRKLESYAKLRLSCTHRIKGGSACLYAQGLTSRGLNKRGRGHSPPSTYLPRLCLRTSSNRCAVRTRGEWEIPICPCFIRPIPLQTTSALRGRAFRGQRLLSRRLDRLRGELRQCIVVPRVSRQA